MPLEADRSSNDKLASPSCAWPRLPSLSACAALGARSDREGGNEVFVRIARFEGGDPSEVDDSIARVRAMMEQGPTPPGLENARRLDDAR